MTKKGARQAGTERPPAAGSRGHTSRSSTPSVPASPLPSLPGTLLSSEIERESSSQRGPTGSCCPGTFRWTEQRRVSPCDLHGAAPATPPFPACGLPEPGLPGSLGVGVSSGFSPAPKLHPCPDRSQRGQGGMCAPGARYPASHSAPETKKTPNFSLQLRAPRPSAAVQTPGLTLPDPAHSQGPRWPCLQVQSGHWPPRPLWEVACSPCSQVICFPPILSQVLSAFRP